MVSGRNNYGQLGLGHNNDQNKFIENKYFENKNIIKIFTLSYSTKIWCGKIIYIYN